MGKDLVNEPTKSPAFLISEAIAAGSDLDKLDKLLTLQERWEAGQAKKAYNKAMAKFKEYPPVIIKDKVNSQYGSKYSSLENLVNTINPVLSLHGLSASWDIKQNGEITVLCKITHELGHSEVVTASAPSDKSGAKNVIQQIKSTVTYLKIVTLESICGLASSDGNVSDDGNSAIAIKAISKEQVKEISNLLGKENPAKILKFAKADKIENIRVEDFAKVISVLKATVKK